MTLGQSCLFMKHGELAMKTMALTFDEKAATFNAINPPIDHATKTESLVIVSLNVFAIASKLVFFDAKEAPYKHGKTILLKQLNLQLKSSQTRFVVPHPCKNVQSIIF